MGRSARNADLYDEIIRRRLEEMAIKPEPISLSAVEADLENHPLRELSEPIRVRAFVRYPELVVDVLADAVRCNDRSVELRWRAPDGSGRVALVWANAVRRLGPPPIPMRDRDLGPWYSRNIHDPDPPPPGPR